MANGGIRADSSFSSRSLPERSVEASSEETSGRSESSSSSSSSIRVPSVVVRGTAQTWEVVPPSRKAVKGKRPGASIGGAMVSSTPLIRIPNPQTLETKRKGERLDLPPSKK
ncbi:unnamed protein product, partial [Microthlaspi erraticum]